MALPNLTYVNGGRLRIHCRRLTIGKLENHSSKATSRPSSELEDEISTLNRAKYLQNFFLLLQWFGSVPRIQSSSSLKLCKKPRRLVIEKLVGSLTFRVLAFRDGEQMSKLCRKLMISKTSSLNSRLENALMILNKMNCRLFLRHTCWWKGLHIQTGSGSEKWRPGLEMCANVLQLLSPKPARSHFEATSPALSWSLIWLQVLSRLLQCPTSKCCLKLRAGKCESLTPTSR